MERLKLYQLKKGDKLYCACSDGSSFCLFDHMDGRYCLCVTEKGALLHLNSMMQIVKVKDGYRISAW